eukprot:UN06075
MWNAYDDIISPEEFGEQYAKDLGLSGEWSVLIAHTIRKKVLEHRMAVSNGYASGLQYSTDHFRQFVRSTEDFDTGKWVPQVSTLQFK